MTTRYQTPWGPSWDPLEITMHTDGGDALGKVNRIEKAIARWSAVDADLLEVTCALDPANAPLLDTSGSVLISARVGPERLLAVPAVSVVEDAGDPVAGRIRVIAAGARTLLDAAVAPPDPHLTLESQPPRQESRYRGTVEDIVKGVIVDAVRWSGHPIRVLPSHRRGRTVTLTSKLTPAGDLIDEALAGSGHRLDVIGWIPGDPLPTGITATAPCALIDVVPWRARPGLIWSAEAGDIDTWALEHRRATITAVLTGERLDNPGADDDQPAGYRYRAHDRGARPWATRWAYRGLRGGQSAEATAAELLEDSAAAASADIRLTPAAQWRPQRHAGAGTYWLGDRVQVSLPVVGVVEQVITEIVATMTPSTFHIAPVVATPDSLSRSIHRRVARLGERVARLERGQA